MYSWGKPPPNGFGMSVRQLELVMTEKDVERYLIRRVQARGGLCWKWVSPGRAGVPDRIVVLPPGQVMFVEVKRPGQQPTSLQRHVLDVLANLGCRVAWVDSKEAVDAFFA
jgi:hypothetical protein